jgi:phenylalanyl-tRNA synthetase alpha chain
MVPESLLPKSKISSVSWTDAQQRRLSELDCRTNVLSYRFESHKVRDREFLKLEKALVLINKKRLQEFQNLQRRPSIEILEEKLTGALIRKGFVQVTTPILMAGGLLSRMGIDENHQLRSQIYWVDSKRCLRPMLAPHLYFILKDLLRICPKPVRLFEVGPCFRRETQGMQHAGEFTMLNVVEMGLDMDSRDERLNDIINIVMQGAGISEYQLEQVNSCVYGKTTDVIAGGRRMEVGSGAVGPHRLDRAWKIRDPWVGVGFGLERLLMVGRNVKSIKKVGRSLGFIDGIRLNI